MHAVVLIDEHDRPVRPALTWADRRSAEQVRRLRQSQDVFTAACSNPVVEAFTAPKLAWMADHEPQALARARRLVQPKDVLRHRLTGSWGTDTTDACGTLLYDVRRGSWDEALWRLCGADPSLAPDVSGSADVVGTVTTAAGAALGLASGTPVVAGAGDVSSAGPRRRCRDAGHRLRQCGHGCPGVGAGPGTGRRDYFVFGRAGAQGYLAMASVYAAGLSVDWVAESLLSGTPGSAGGGSAARRHGDHRGRRSSGRPVRPAPARHQRARPRPAGAWRLPRAVGRPAAGVAGPGHARGCRVRVRRSRCPGRAARRAHGPAPHRWRAVEVRRVGGDDDRSA